MMPQTSRPPASAISTNPIAAAIPPELRRLSVPVLSPQTQAVEPWGPLAIEALASRGLTLDQLRVPGLRRPYFGEADRPLFAEATEFGLGPPERDEFAGDSSRRARSARFVLPRGAYATVVLRAMGQ